MKRVFLLLRLVAILKRIAVALERIAAANEAVVPEIRRAPKLAQVFTPSVEQRNEIYDEESGYITRDLNA